MRATTVAPLLLIALGGCVAPPTATSRGLTLRTIDADELTGTYVATDGLALTFAARRDAAGIVSVDVRGGRRSVILLRAVPGALVLRIGDSDGRAALAGDADASRGVLAFATTPDWAAFVAMRHDLGTALFGAGEELYPLLTGLDVAAWTMNVIAPDARSGVDATTCEADPYPTLLGLDTGECATCAAEPTPVPLPESPPRSPPTSPPSAMEHHIDDCHGQCGFGCTAPVGQQFCTPECLAIDECAQPGNFFSYSCCFEKHSWGGKSYGYFASMSYLKCFSDPASCACAGPHE